MSSRSSTSPRRRPLEAARSAVVALCFALSGAAALVFQTAWTQQLTLVFGASELAIVSVLTAFMVGLALGAALGARLADRTERPLRVYGLLEAGVGLYALALPVAIQAIAKLQSLWFTRDTLGEAAAVGARSAFQFGAATLLLLPPTICMGMTLPLLVRHSTHSAATLGTTVGRLYAINTLGAASGALLTGFVLLPRLGLGRAAAVAVGLAFSVALLALPLSRPRPSARGGGPLAGLSQPAAAVPARAGWPLPVAALAGGIGMSLEILWTRLLTYVLGGSIYAFAIMLAAFLVAIALGSAVASRLGSTPSAAARALPWALLSGATLLLLTFRAADALPRAIERLAGAGELPAVAAALSFALMVPAATCLGGCFVLAVRARAGDLDRVAEVSGRVLAWNTVGAVAGVLATGLWLLPWLAFAGLARLLAGLCFATAGAIALLAGIGRIWIGALALAGLLWLALAPPRSPSNLLRTAPVALLAGHSPGADEAGRGMTAVALTAYGEVERLDVGRSASVVLHREGAELRLASNGLPESAVQPPGGRLARYAVTRWLTLLPTALRADIRSLMVVGFGAGHSVEELPPSIETIDVVELEPAVLEANRAVAAYRRRDPLADPRVRIHLDDARSALALSRARFDAIVSQPSHPWTAGSSSLFTDEFFSLVGRHLRPGGIFVQWAGLDFLDETLVRSLFATLKRTFPFVECYRPHPGGAILFAASDRPLDLGESAEIALARDPGFWRALGVATVEDLWIARTLDDRGVTELARHGAISSDGLNLLQTRSPRLLGAGTRIEEFDRLSSAFDALRGLPRPLDGSYVVRQLLEQRSPRRALRVAVSLADDERQRETFALLDLSGFGPSTRRRPARDRANAVESRETLSTELLLAREAIRDAGVTPSRFASFLEQDAAAKALVATWTAGAAGATTDDWRRLDLRLAEVEPTHALYRASLRERVDLRLRHGSATDCAEAVESLDFLLATTLRPGDLLLRAHLGLRAGRPEIAIASLDELAKLAPQAGELHETALREALKILAATPADSLPDARSAVARLLVHQLRTESQTAAPPAP